MSWRVGTTRRCCSNFGQMGPCHRHRIEDVVAVCVGFSRHFSNFWKCVSRNILWYGITYAHQLLPQHALNAHFMDLLLPPRSFFIRLTLLQQRCWNNELCLWLGTSWSVPETTGSSVFYQVYGRWLQPPSPSHVPDYMGEWWWGCSPSARLLPIYSRNSANQQSRQCLQWLLPHLFPLWGILTLLANPYI